MAILVITVNKECCRCKEKLDKILNHLRCKYCIEKIEYEGEKVIVRGSFCAEQLRKCIWRKAGCKIIVNILIVEVWPPVVVTPPPPVVNVNVKADVTASATAAAEAAAKAAVDVIIKNCKPPPPPPCNKPPAECSKPKPECKPVPCPYPVPYYYPMPWCCPDQPPPPCNVKHDGYTCDNGKYCIEKIEYEGEKVIVRGNFCAEKLRKCIWRKAGCKIIVNILIVEVWPPVVVVKPPPPPVEVNVSVKTEVTASAKAAAEAAAKAAVELMIKDCKPPPCNKPPDCKLVPCPKSPCPKPPCPDQPVCPPPCPKRPCQQQQQHFCPQPYCGCGCVICNRNNVNVMMFEQDSSQCSVM
uniref:HMA domain-containing protein n=1 Tax=Leersia perrieri TaxID=77586 RepID=A0A0D9W4G0_9ORYZ